MPLLNAKLMNNPTPQTNQEVVIVTGSSGLVATSLLKKLAGQYHLVGLDKVRDPYPLPEVECINFDLTSIDSIRAALERVRYAYGDKIASVIHLAAYYDFSGEPSPLYDKITVEGTAKLIEALQDFKVTQFVFSSTNLVYKPSEPGTKINEDWPLAPNWDYPESKVKTERLIQEKRNDMKSVRLRIAGVYDDWGHSIPIGHQIQRIYEKQFTSHFYSGDTDKGNVFVHLDDLTDALIRTIEKRNELPDDVAINIGEPESPSYAELQETIGCEIHGKDWKTYEVPAPLAKAGAYGMNLVGDAFIKPWMIDRADDHYELDVTRAQQLLGWQPRHRVLDTLPVMIKNLKADPQKWYKANKLGSPD